MNSKELEFDGFQTTLTGWLLGQLPMWSGITQPQSLLNVRSHFLSLPKISSPQGLGTLLQTSWRGLTAMNPQGTLARVLRVAL